MVNIKDKKYKKYCEEKGCEILANFNLPGKKKGKFCSFHKLHNMIDIFSKNVMMMNAISVFGLAPPGNQLHLSQNT